MKELRIANWFMIENFNENERIIIESADNITVEKETENAINVKFDSDYGIIACWLPKSVVTTDYQYKVLSNGTGEFIKIATGEIKEIKEKLKGAIKTTDNKIYLNRMVEFI